MATIYLDNKTYNEAALYAKLNNISIADVLKAGIKALLGDMKIKSKVNKSDKYYVSPKVKSMETGFVCPLDLSEDYREEFGDVIMSKYL